jgi:hypothetical protein
MGATMSKFFDELMESVIEMDEILRKNHRDSDSNADTSVLTFQQKQAHYDKVRRSNYLASLSIEGFETTPADAEKPLPSRMEVLKKYRQKPG